MKIKTAVVVTAALAVAVFSTARAEEPTYIGVERCAKMCHKVEYTSWLETKHAKAWDSLKPEEQKKDCANCHRTTETFTGIQCEACHGPGSAYSKLAVMKDPALAKAAGLKKPAEADCKKCHNEKSPNFKGFNYAEMVKKVHQHKPKAQ